MARQIARTDIPRFLFTSPTSLVDSPTGLCLLSIKTTRPLGIRQLFYLTAWLDASRGPFRYACGSIQCPGETMGMCWRGKGIG